MCPLSPLGTDLSSLTGDGSCNSGNHMLGGLVYLRRHLVLLLSMAAFGSTGAWANDIRCAPTRQPAERVICGHAILNNEYGDIFAQQRALLSSGKLLSE